jgi:short-subunit dehydrogenase
MLCCNFAIHIIPKNELQMTFSVVEKNRLKKKYGPWAIITGASSGIGFALAERLAEAGLNLVLNARNEERLQETSKLLTSKFKIEIKIVAADVSTSEGIDQLLKTCATVEIGLLVASAGYGTSGPFIHSSIHTEIDMLRVNCEAVLILTHYFAQQFAKRKRGGIILLSSIVAFQGVPYAAHYAATKAYIQSLAEGLAEELNPFAVDVLAAAPGPVESGFGKRANMQIVNALTPSKISVPILKALGRRTTVLPGSLSKILAYSLRTVPRWGKVKIMKKVMTGMTSKQ